MNTAPFWGYVAQHELRAKQQCEMAVPASWWDSWGNGPMVAYHLLGSGDSLYFYQSGMGIDNLWCSLEKDWHLYNDLDEES